MMNPKYNIGEIVNDLLIINYALRRKSPNGTNKFYYNIECLKCGNQKEMSTQTIKRAKSCGCIGNKGKPKPVNSGRQSPKDTLPQVNIIISTYKTNARNRNLSFELSYNDFALLIKSECYFCGKLESNILNTKHYETFKYNGIDRLNNEFGYVKNNCVSCCSWCNEAKNNSNIEFFINQCQKITSRFGQKEQNYWEISNKRLEEVLL